MKQLVVEIEITDIWLVISHFHSWHGYDGLCLNWNFVSRIRFLGALWEPTVTKTYMVNHAYNEAYFCKMINRLLI